MRNLYSVVIKKVHCVKGDSSLPKRALQRTVLVVTLVMLAVSGVVTFIGLNISTSYILMSSNAMKQSMLSIYQQEVENKLSSISQQINLFLLNEDVWELIYSDTAKNDYILIRNVLQKVKNRYYMDGLVDSMYFFDQAHAYVLADAYYQKSSFYDPTVFTDDFIAQAPISSVRNVNGKDIFSIIYRPLTTSGANPITIVVNISVAQLELLLPFSDQLGHFVMTNDRNEVLYASDHPQSLESLICKALLLKESPGIVTVGADRYLAASTSPTSEGALLYIFQDYQRATHARAMLRSLVLPAVLLVLIGAVFLALAASFYLYRPLRKLISHLSSEGYVLSASNEYALIGQVVDHLATSKREIEQKYHEVSHYRDLYSLQEFLINPVLNQAEFSALLQRLGLHFHQPFYALFVLELCKQQGASSHRIVMPDASLCPAVKNVIASQISHDRVAFLVNVAQKEALDAEGLGNILCRWFEEQSFIVYCAQSEAFVRIDELPAHYNLCDTSLRQQRFRGRGDGNVTTAPEVPILSLRLEKDLLSAVKAGSESTALDTLSQLITLYAEDFPAQAMEILHYRLSRLCLEIIGATHADKVAEIISNPAYVHFQRLRRANTLQEISVELGALIHETLEQNSQLAQQRNTHLVVHAKKFISENLTRNISLEEIAQSVYLSTNYFCSVFKAETGMTVMDYVAGKRIDLACQMLIENPHIQINTLATRLGYNSVQSFIRQFKKIMQATPDQYRKGHLHVP